MEDRTAEETQAQVCDYCCVARDELRCVFCAVDVGDHDALVENGYVLVRALLSERTRRLWESVGRKKGGGNVPGYWPSPLSVGFRG